MRDDDDDCRTRRVFIEVDIAHDGRLDLKLSGAKGDRIWGSPESLPDSTSRVIEELFDVDPERIGFVSTRNHVEDRAWVNLGISLVAIDEHTPDRLNLAKTVSAWNTWVLQRPGGINLGVAQRLEPARDVHQWVQVLTR